ncbi:MAG: ferritin family protein [bacterium]|nr:ferritin family protein [bacterium]
MMSDLLKASEVVGFAVHIEQNGYAFYTEAAKKFNNKDLMDFFHYLAQEEQNHERTFKKLKEEVGDYKPQESYEGEYDIYMQDYLKSIKPKSREEMTAKINALTSMDEALDLALRFEKDSVLFFAVLKKIVAPEQRQFVEKIIEEEVGHAMKIQHFRAKKLNIPAAPDVHAL